MVNYTSCSRYNQKCKKLYEIKNKVNHILGTKPETKCKEGQLKKVKKHVKNLKAKLKERKLEKINLRKDNVSFSDRPGGS